MKVIRKNKRRMDYIDRDGEVNRTLAQRSTSGCNAACWFKGKGYWQRISLGGRSFRTHYVGPTS
jgi:hypothetical protein